MKLYQYPHASRRAVVGIGHMPIRCTTGVIREEARESLSSYVIGVLTAAVEGTINP